MGLNLAERIVVFDAEYTSWEGSLARNWSGPGEYQEIVQIGAVRVDTRDFSETSSLVLYIKPRRNPVLSDYFIKLTSITQETVDAGGMDIAAALEKFREWSGDDLMYSWGNDGEDLEANCELEGIPFPFDRARFLDVRTLFASAGIDTKGYMSSTIVRAFGEESKRRGHDALSDARTIVDGLRLLSERK